MMLEDREAEEYRRIVARAIARGEIKVAANEAHQAHPGESDDDYKRRLNRERQQRFRDRHRGGVL